MYEQGEDLRHQKYVMKCYKYYYLKQKDSNSNKINFQIFFIYSLAECDLFEIIKYNRKNNLSFSEKKVI
jgi:hypothetical protein